MGMSNRNPVGVFNSAGLEFEFPSEPKYNSPTACRYTSFTNAPWRNSAALSTQWNQGQQEPWDSTVISIVDDDASVREAMFGLVRSLGFDAATFSSAEDFLQSDQIEATLCLITDVQMPGLSGVELQSQLISRGRP